MSSTLEFPVDDLVLIADSMEENVRRLLIWKEATEEKGVEGKCRKDHRSLKFGPYITYIALKPKAHGVIT